MTLGLPELLDPCFDSAYDDIIESAKRNGILEMHDSVPSLYDNGLAHEDSWTPERRRRVGKAVMERYWRKWNMRV